MKISAERPEGARVWRTVEAVHVDVRGLVCPEPLVTVLRLIDGGDAGETLIAYLSQEPLLLYPELDDRGWRHRLISSTCTAQQDENVVLEIKRPRP